MFKSLRHLMYFNNFKLLLIKNQFIILRIKNKYIIKTLLIWYFLMFCDTQIKYFYRLLFF